MRELFFTLKISIFRASDYIITGASGSGKTACLPYVKEQLPDHEVVDFDDIGVPENADKTWPQE